MKLIYLTSKSYPGRTADHNFVKNMAKTFSQKLGEDFLFVGAKLDEEEFQGVNKLNLRLEKNKGRALFYFFWLPFFYFKRRNEGLIFFSNDSYLILILIFWKKIFRLKYFICSDWHQMFSDFRDKLMARGSDFLITTSDRLKKLLIEKTGVSGEKIITARGGADLKKFQINSKSEIPSKRKMLGLPEDKKLVGYIGGFKTMGMDKGIGIMIKALKFLRSDFAMVFVGGKEKEIEEYKEIAEREKVSERVIFLEYQKEEKIAEYEEAMDILVIPYPDSLHFREWGFPMKVYEYMASGTPIIYSDLDLINEVLKGRGLSFKPEDEKDLASKINFLTENKSEGEKMTKEAKTSVKNFTWESRAEKILKFIIGNSDRSRSAQIFK
ncbi:MAG: glycosyltransferase family 4 protein [Candidatus Paceibacterota bacterium]